ncbi:hypothetical protein HMPREF2559_05965 [Corynebacterium sp. HMSC072G08]|nr:hypothetical protein HMPREF2559_05965 [Corynebacterium sp. HMSC072G08]
MGDFRDFKADPFIGIHGLVRTPWRGKYFRNGVQLDLKWVSMVTPLLMPWLKRELCKQRSSLRMELFEARSLMALTDM